ncbi:hypothetical protein PMAC_000378 [Pneumocystis sp. 'macacae']|nr:hypothetical protein PMAC_000378 [Pneumocystis sp. 'macacae']
MGKQCIFVHLVYFCALKGVRNSAQQSRCEDYAGHGSNGVLQAEKDKWWRCAIHVEMKDGVQ